MGLAGEQVHVNTIRKMDSGTRSARVRTKDSIENVK